MKLDYGNVMPARDSLLEKIVFFYVNHSSSPLQHYQSSFGEPMKHVQSICLSTSVRLNLVPMFSPRLIFQLCGGCQVWGIDE